MAVISDLLLPCEKLNFLTSYSVRRDEYFLKQDISQVKIEEKPTNKVSLEDVKDQVSSYGQQINQYLERIGAKMENYKFDVLKVPSGISLDIAFKASFTFKNNETTAAVSTARK
jgi:hypothetical protein